GLRVAVRAIRAAGEDDRTPALPESGGRQREFLVAPSPTAAADRDGRLSSGDDRDRSRGGIPSKSLRNHNRSHLASLSFHRGRKNVRGIALSLRFLPRRFAGPSVVGHDHVVDGAGGRRGPNFVGLRGRPKNALHGRGHRIPQTVPLEDRLRPLTPRRAQGRWAGADVVDRIPDDIRQDETDHRGAAGRGSLGEAACFDFGKALGYIIDVSYGEPGAEQ